MNKQSIAGILLFIGAFQFFIFMTISEALRPSYSVNLNYISDLGVGANAYIFNYSIISLGILVIISAIALASINRRKILPYTVILIGIGAMGVGIFNENAPYHLHDYVSLITFLFSGISAIVAVTWAKGPFRALSAIVGIFILVAMGLYIENIYYSLGPGGMERMIVYPTILWGMAFSGYLIGPNRGSS